MKITFPAGADCMDYGTIQPGETRTVGNDPGQIRQADSDAFVTNGVALTVTEAKQKPGKDAPDQAVASPESQVPSPE